MTPRLLRASVVVLLLSAQAIGSPVASAGSLTPARVARVPNQPAASPLPANSPAQPAVPASFVNDVVPTLARLGCSQGACHGAQQGKGGFKLSLRGYAPELDYLSITHENKGRRLNRDEPERSLLLRKPLLQLAHAGGKRLDQDSPEYRTLVAWLSHGAPGPGPREPRLTRLELQPGERVMRPGENQRLRVRAVFSDGCARDVTPRVLFQSNEASIARVSPAGVVTAVAPGETAVVARYMDQVAIFRVTTPYPFRVNEAAFQRRGNAVDDLVLAKLRTLQIEPSGLCTDSDFVRRVYIDAIGTLPSAEEARAFLDDRDPDKRSRLVDAVLQRPEFGQLWALKMADLFLLRKEYMGRKNTLIFQQWLADQFRQPRPGWARIASDILTASGPLTEQPQGLFYVSRQQMRAGEKYWIRSPELTGEIVAQVFLGTRIQCARCHNHPTDRYTQEDYYRFVALFAQVTGEGGEGPIPEKVVAAHPGQVQHPRTGEVVQPGLLDRGPLALPDGADRRRQFAAWLTRSDNERFSATMVNRLWARCFGSGIVEPVDDLSATNPARNTPLLRALARDLASHDYDIKYLLGTIMKSRTYQASAETRPGNRGDTRYFSHQTVRRLPAEELLDAVSQVTGVPERFSGYALGTRAVEISDAEFPSDWLDTFGRPPRVQPCDCERTTAPSVSQALALLNSEAIQSRIKDPDGRLALLVKNVRSDPTLIEELFLSAFARRPTAAERQAVEQSLSRAPSREEGFQDLLWALLNSKEFMFNH